MPRYFIKLAFGLALAILFTSFAFWSIWGHDADDPQDTDEPVQVGFGETQVTPVFDGKPVFLAGFGHNRRATAVHDPLMARAVVLRHGDRKIAIVSVDLVGLFLPDVEEVRKQLPGFDYILVSSTHNHEGPDTLGLWGSNPFSSGVNPDYMDLVRRRIVKAIQEAEQSLRPARARLGTAQAPELLHDNREPYIKHDELVALQFVGDEDRLVGIVVQWNCHPETLSSDNTEISADFVYGTVRQLQETYRCPVVYLTGTVGGLMTSLKVEVRDRKGRTLADGTFEKTEQYGRLVGQLAEKALAGAQAVRLTPIQVHSRQVFLPLENQVYQLGRQIGVLKRPAYLWTGDSGKAEPADDREFAKPLCLRTEVAWLRLGELDIAAIPGEIYPELVLDQVQSPADPGADFPDAAVEPAIYKQLPGPYRMIVGLANDEIGYIIPKRQWDAKPPFCYGRRKAQYGEINSVGPETAPLLCAAFREMVQSAK